MGAHMPTTVAAKQIVFHAEHMFVVDAAGQVWYSQNYELKDPRWQRVELPPFKA